MTVYFVTDEPWPTSVETLAAADIAGASTVLHGIPPALVDVIPPGTLGAFDVPDPEPVEPPVDPVAALQDQLAAQQALIDELLAALGGGGNG